MRTTLENLAGAGRGDATRRTEVDAWMRSIAARARRLWQAYWHRRACRAAALMLQSLDDRTLKDIGLPRGEIWAVVLDNDAARSPPDDPHRRKLPER